MTDFGVAGVVTEATLRPDDLARTVEELGFESLFLGEHTHIPASRDSAYPGGELKSDYWHTLDPFVALTAAAGATRGLRLGTGVCLLVERDPIICAKEVASLDYLSGGRIELAVGAGWNLEEMRNHGVSPESRFAVLREKVEAMRAIWTADEASYDGEWITFERIWSWPKPLQPAGVPILLAGNGPRSERRVAEYGDGWAPLHSPQTPQRIRRARERGLRVPVTVFSVPSDARQLESYAHAGADRVLYWLDSASGESARRELDVYRAAVNEFLGRSGGV